MIEKITFTDSNRYQSSRIKALRCVYGDDATIEPNPQSPSNFKVNGEWRCVDTSKECLIEGSWWNDGFIREAVVKADGMVFHVF